MVLGERGLFICVVVALLALTGGTQASGAGSQATGMNGSSSASSEAFPSGSPISLDLSIIGTVLLGDGNDMATILDKKSGNSALYRLGETVDGAMIINIDSDSVEFEKDGRLITVWLKHDGGPGTGTQYSAAGTQPVPAHDAVLSTASNDNSGAGLFEDGSIAENHPPLEPVFIARGPGANSDEPQMDLPYFEPIVSKTGPEATDNEASERPQKELPPFEPVTNYTGPVLKNKKLSRELPQFEPATDAIGPEDSGSASSPVNEME